MSTADHRRPGHRRRPANDAATSRSTDGRSSEVGDATRAGCRRPGARRRRPASSARASSTCTCTCASRAGRRPRPSRPAAGPRRSADSPRSWPCPTPTRPTTASRWSTSCARQGERAGLCEVLPSGSITVGRAGETAHPVRRARRRRRAALHRRRQRRAGSAAHAPGARVRRRARHHARPALRGRAPHGGRGDARGRLLQPPRPARDGRRRRGADAAPRHRTRAAHRRADALPAPVDRRAASSWSGRPRPTGCRSRPRRRPTTSRLTDERLASYDPVYKVNPPLRTADDVAAIRAGLADGTIDAIATDHAPHAPETKEQPLDQAPPGMLGLETALGVSLARSRACRSADVLAALSWQPAAIAGVDDATAARSPSASRPT